MKLKPLADRVIVKQTEAEEKTKSGIYLPDAAKEKPTKGKVVSVGPGKLDDNGKRMQPNVRAGETVYYGKYSATDVAGDGTTTATVLAEAIVQEGLKYVTAGKVNPVIVQRGIVRAAEVAAEAIGALSKKVKG